MLPAETIAAVDLVVLLPLLRLPAQIYVIFFSLLWKKSLQVEQVATEVSVTPVENLGAFKESMTERAAGRTGPLQEPQMGRQARRAGRCWCRW